MNKMKFKFRNEIRREKDFQIGGKSAEISWYKNNSELSFVKDLGKCRQANVSAKVGPYLFR